MKKLIVIACAAMFLFACTNSATKEDKSKADSTIVKDSDTAKKADTCKKEVKEVKDVK